MSIKLELANPEHEIAYEDLCKLVNKHANQLTALELLAIASNMLGKLVALQDQRTVSPEMAMDVVAKNIEVGNKQMRERLSHSKGIA